MKPRTFKILTLSDLENEPEKLLTSAQVKQVLEISDPTLYRWRKMHVIQYYRIGGVFKYKAKDITNLLKQNEL